jgi:hypothetical protein
VSVANTDSASPHTLAGHAHAYAAAGFEVFPVVPSGEDAKQPLVSQYKATTNPDQITEWWHRWPNALIGHRISPDTVILDVDPRHGGDQVWRALLAEFPTRPITRWHRSGRGDGGGHTWWHRPADRTTVTALDEWARERELGHQIPQSDRWSCGIDILHHTHRYTILPPSPHPDTGNPYTWAAGLDTPVAPMPALLADLITLEQAPAPKPPARPPDPDSIADWYTTNHTWDALLTRHGWTLRAGDGNHDGSRWRHPTATSAFSATIRHSCLFVYSPNTPFEVTAPSDPHGYTLYRAYATLEHHGDLKAAGRAARQQKDGPPANVDEWLATLPDTPHTDGQITATGAPDNGAITNPCAGSLISWDAFWTRERNTTDWLIEPLIARGRGHAIGASGKTGKSLLLLDATAARACGRPTLNQPASDPLNIVYFDMEMTEDDLQERLEDLGYGPDDDLTRFHYYLLPTLPPLDTDVGGQLVEQLVILHQAELAVFDTIGRLVAGNENDSDTYLGFYRHTGYRLKKLGCAYARLDHLGKDTTLGQRGSSAKNDDVDVVWQMTKTDDGIRLRGTHRRMSWVPETVNIARDDNGDRLTHRVTDDVWPAKTKSTAAVLDSLDAPLDITRRAASQLLKDHGAKTRNETVSAALRYRRQEAGTDLAWIPE